MTDKPEYLYTALLDVLAYRDLLKNDRDSGRLDFKDGLSESLRVFDDVNEAVFRVQAISDTVIVTCATHNEFPGFLEILRRAFLAFLDQKLFIRGGIAYSQHFQSSRLTYSHAVARAYEIEQTLAVYPRIVIDSNIIPEAASWERAYAAAKSVYIRDEKRLAKSEGAFAKHVWFENYLLTSPHAPPEAERYIPKIGAL